MFGGMAMVIGLIATVLFGRGVVVNAIVRTCSATLTEEVRIGGLMGSADYLFSEIFAIAGRPSGSSYVLDTHPYSIREYDPSGGFVRSIGREGEGPGEYLSPLGVWAMPQGGLAVWDQRTRRISIYGSDGALDDLVHVDAMAVYDDRAFVVGSEEFFVKVRTWAPMVIEDRYVTATRFDYVRVARDGTVLDTLRVAAPTDVVLPEPLMILTHSGYRKPFAVEVLTALSPLGYLVVGDNEEYAFVVANPTRPVEIRRDDWRPARVSRDERAQWQRRKEWSEARSGMSFRNVPDQKPAYRNLWVDSDGRIWIHRYSEAVARDTAMAEVVVDGDPPGITWWEPSVHDVYSPDGSFVFCVTLPDSAEVMASTGDLVWGVFRGPLGEEHVIRWRVVAGEGASTGAQK